ncbi:Na+/galactose cotransporter, partial [Candidatus Sumerlaeota bacterium]|nr:Na+/galactose cotransporter [Candidatus Sumerlaeota bacterium]
AGLAGLVVGVASSFVMFKASDVLFVIKEPFLFIAWWSFVVGIVVTLGVSLVTRAEPPEKLEGLVYGTGEKKLIV